MTTYDSTGVYIIPREITFYEIDLPVKRAVSIVFANGVERSVIFYFTFIEDDDSRMVEIYWWEDEEKKIGFYGRLEELYPIMVVHPHTRVTEFIVIPRVLREEEIVEGHTKSIRVSPNIWVYEVDQS